MDDTDTRYSFLYRCLKCRQMQIDVCKTCIPVFQRYVSNIYVNGIPRKISVEKIYRGSSMHGKIFYLVNERHHSNKKCDLPAVYVIHNHSIL